MVEEVDTIVNQVAELYLKDKSYEEHLVPQWIDTICEDCMQQLSALGKPFKYIGACVCARARCPTPLNAARCPPPHPARRPLHTALNAAHRPIPHARPRSPPSSYTARRPPPAARAVTAVIMQKTGAGIHSAAACYDHPETDGMYTVKWPSDKHKDHNRYLMCIVTVFGLSLSG